MRFFTTQTGRVPAWNFVCLFVLACVMTSCAKSEMHGPMTSAAEGVTKAVCVVHPLGDSGVTGEVTFVQGKDGVLVTAELTGLTPGEHGFHVHQFGDCSAADGTSAGGHFNPDGEPHAGPDAPQRHVGDLGNITADASGKATYERVDRMLALGGPHSIIGRSIIVHGGQDDLTSQPSGAAGPRVGCGVIGIADPSK